MTLPQLPTRSSTPGEVLFSLAMFVVINGVLVRAALRRMRATASPNRWMWFVPIAPVVFVVTRIAWDTAHDPTSHNLWPFELVIVGVPCAFIWWVAGVMLARSAK